MSAAAVVPVMKFVGTALAVKSAIDGLQEGNLMKAAIGAAGAYYGMSSLASAGTASTSVAGNTAAKTAGSQAMAGAGQSTAAEMIAADAAGQAAQGIGAEQIASNVASTGANQAVAQQAGSMAASGAAASEMSQALSATMASPTVQSMGSEAMTESARNVASDPNRFMANKSVDPFSAEGSAGMAGGNVGDTSKSASFFDDPNAWMKENEGMVTAGTGLLQSAGGFIQGQQEREMWDERMDLERDSMAMSQAEQDRINRNRAYAAPMYQPNLRKIYG